MLLSELSPLDVRQLSICHKGPFYHSYGRWSDAKRGWVADVLEREYKFDKAGAGAALFGPEPAMDETSPPGHTGPSTGTPVQAVGP